MNNEITNDQRQNRKGQFLSPDKGISFRRQGRLIQDAFLVSSLIEILDNIFERQSAPGELEVRKLEAGQNLLKNLEKAERYVTQEKTNLMAQPENVEVIVSIIDEGWSQPGIDIAKTSEMIDQIKGWETQGTSFLEEEHQTVVKFLRTIHRGILDQLTEPSDSPFGS